MGVAWVYGRFVAGWIAASAVGMLGGVLVGQPVALLVGLTADVSYGIVADAACVGVVVGLCQAYVLRPVLPRARHWVVGTGAPWAAGALLASAISGEEGPMRDLSRLIDALWAANADGGSALWLSLAAVLAACGALVGAATGAGQWLVLRRRFRRSGWWVPTSTAAWSAGAALGVPGGALGWLANLLLVGAVAGACTGPVLVWLCRHPRD